MGGSVGTTSPAGSAWYGAKLNHAWTGGSRPVAIINSLMIGWTVTNDKQKYPVLAPNTSYTALGARIKIAFTDKRNYTVTARSY